MEISQDDADAQAQNKFNTTGLDYANSNGICELKGINSVNKTNSSENIEVHIFEGLEMVTSSQFPW